MSVFYVYSFDLYFSKISIVVSAVIVVQSFPTALALLDSFLYHLLYEYIWLGLLLWRLLMLLDAAALDLGHLLRLGCALGNSWSVTTCCVSELLLWFLEYSMRLDHSTVFRTISFRFGWSISVHKLLLLGQLLAHSHLLLCLKWVLSSMVTTAASVLLTELVRRSESATWGLVGVDWRCYLHMIDSCMRGRLIGLHLC